MVVLGKARQSPKVGDAKRHVKMRWGQERDRTFRSSTGRADVQSCKNEVKPSTGQPRMGDWKWCSDTLRAVGIKRRTIWAWKASIIFGIFGI